LHHPLVAAIGRGHFHINGNNGVFIVPAEISSNLPFPAAAMLSSATQQQWWKIFLQEKNSTFFSSHRQLQDQLLSSG
jgi:hypothetical protein